MRRHRQQGYGFALPNNGEGRRYLHELLLVESLNPKPTDKLLMNTIETVAPWMKPDEANTFIEHINRIPPKERWRDPVELGKILQVTNGERERLKLWTIQPCDMTSDELEKQRKAKRRSRQQRLRQKRSGAATRAEYLATHTANRTKPWLDHGISRATWYRQQRETSAWPLNLSTTGYEPVSRSTLDRRKSPPACHRAHVANGKAKAEKPKRHGKRA